MARWGLRFDQGQGVLSVAATLPAGEREAAVGPFRVGRSVVALRLRRTPSAVTLRIVLSFGPPLRLDASLAEALGQAPVVVDDIPLGRSRVSFEATGTHEVIWRH